MGWISKVIFDETIGILEGETLVITYEGFCDVSRIELIDEDGNHVRYLKFKKVEN